MDNIAIGSLFQDPTGWYKVVPYIKEDRGHLKSLGIQAPLTITDVGGITIIHIRENLPYQNIAELNVYLRGIFGPATLVLGLEKDIDFYKLEKCSNEEINHYQTFGNPILAEARSGDNELNQIERHSIEGTRRTVNARGKPPTRTGSKKSNRKTSST